MQATEIVGFVAHESVLCTGDAERVFGKPALAQGEDEFGNPITPIFASDEGADATCAVCNDTLL